MNHIFCHIRINTQYSFNSKVQFLKSRKQLKRALFQVFSKKQQVEKYHGLEVWKAFSNISDEPDSSRVGKGIRVPSKTIFFFQTFAEKVDIYPDKSTENIENLSIYTIIKFLEITNKFLDMKYCDHHDTLDSSYISALHKSTRHC